MTFGYGFDAIDAARKDQLVSTMSTAYDEGDSQCIGVLIFSDRYHSSDAEAALGENTNERPTFQLGLRTDEA
ncbi:hypothetical protein AAE026_21440 [Bradyrhizobium sp. DN5]|uniref:hypothetical protein n=1 Tax=Bradyrhizobium sp. DN5 TaxID=3056950 RepID=UPI003523A250